MKLLATGQDLYCFVWSNINLLLSNIIRYKVKLPWGTRHMVRAVKGVKGVYIPQNVKEPLIRKEKAVFFTALIYLMKT